MGALEGHARSLTLNAETELTVAMIAQPAIDEILKV
jgi:hypothetical protein